MIYLRHTTEAQSLFIPRNGGTAEGLCELRLKNTTDKRRAVEAVVDISVSRIYYALAVTLPEDLSVGEYEYELAIGEDVLSTGLLFVGEYESGSEQYNTENIYEQYQA